MIPFIVGAVLYVMISLGWTWYMPNIKKLFGGYFGNQSDGDLVNYFMIGCLVLALIGVARIDTPEAALILAGWVVMAVLSPAIAPPAMGYSKSTKMDVVQLGQSAAKLMKARGEDDEQYPLDLQAEINKGMAESGLPAIDINELLTVEAQEVLAVMFKFIAFRAAMRPSDQEASEIIPAQMFWHVLSAPYSYTELPITGEQLRGAAVYLCLDRWIQEV